MRRLTSLLIVVCVVYGLLGCDPKIESECRTVSESVFVNEQHSFDIEPFSSDSLLVFTFELDFHDTVSVFATDKLLAKGYLVTKSNGLAGQLKVKAQSNEEIVINTSNGCAHFKLRGGYKYLYVNRLNNKKWTIEYSNFGRGYF
jgi:hypothetical protein